MRRAIYETEADLCDAFVARLRPNWTVYPETCGWDLLLVDDDGVQVGVQAKLRANLDVIAQSLGSRRDRGPDYHVALVPAEAVARGGAWDAVVYACHVHAIRFGPYSYDWPLPKPEHLVRFDHPPPMRWSHAERHVLPEFIPRVRAGVPAPLQLTPWRIKAIRLCVLLRRRGWLTRADFKAAGVDPQRWIAKRWLVADGRIGALTRYVAGPTPLPDVDHAEVAAEIAAESGTAE